jgi:hypothetical protein
MEVKSGTKKQMQCQKSSKETNTTRKTISTWVIFINKHLSFETWFTSSFTDMLLWQKPTKQRRSQNNQQHEQPSTKFSRKRHQYQWYINWLRNLILLLVLGPKALSSWSAFVVQTPFIYSWRCLSLFRKKRLADRCFEAKPNMKKWERHLPVVRINGL